MSVLTATMIRQAADGIDGVADMKFRSYSGRGMGGKECAAVSLENLGDLLKLGASLAYQVAAEAEGDASDAADAIDDLIGGMGSCRLDSLGHDYIAYWPGVPFEADGEGRLMDENETVEELADALASAAAAVRDMEIDCEVTQDMRSGGYFFEATDTEGRRFSVLVQQMDD